MSDLHLVTDRPHERDDIGGELLDEVRGFLARFVAFPSPAALDAATLWVALAHMVLKFHTAPRIAFLSPEPGSGKTRALEVLHLVTPDAMFIFSASPAAIFRTLANRQVVLLFDEIDAVFSHRGKDDSNEDLRALINVGYKRGAAIPRCVGPAHDVVHFPVFGAVALAGLGDLPDTIMTRSVIVRMRRRGPGERVEAFRTRVHEAEGHLLRGRLAAWADKVGEEAGQAWPKLPHGITDRPAEVWEPLLAVADAAGGHWPTDARTACVDLVMAGGSASVSLGVRLLEDLRVIFTAAPGPALTTKQILDRLTGEQPYGKDSAGDDLTLTDAPWSDLRGAPLDPRGLARYLKRYEVASKKVKIGEKSFQGYRREDLHDAFQRYLSPVPADPEPPEPPERATSEGGVQVPDGNQVPEPRPRTEPQHEALTLEGSAGSGGSGLAEDDATCAAGDAR